MNVLRKWPIRRQLYLIAYLTLAVIVVMQFFSYSKTSEIITQENEKNTKELFDQLKQTILSNSDIINWLAPNIAYNQLVQEYLMEKDPTNKYMLYGKLHNLLLNLAGVKYGILDFVITGNNGNLFSLNSGASLTSTMGDFIPSGAINYFSGVQQCDFGTVQSPTVKTECFAVGTRINSSDYSNGFGSEIGKLIILIDAKTLTGNSGLLSVKDKSSLYLLDRSNKIFMSNDPAMIGRTFDISSLHPDAGKGPLFTDKINGKLQHIQIEDLPMVEGKVVRLIPDEVFFKDIRAVRRTNFLVFGVAGMLLVILFIYIISNIMKPLQKLSNYMAIVRRGDLEKRIDLYGSVEMEVISNQFNSMLSELQQLTGKLLESNERLLKAEIATKQSEVAFLKSQVNPHFLYNTLDSIRGIAAVRKVPEIRDIAKSLGDIFRYSIKGNDFVPLSEELRVVNAYIQIQLVRFSNRFEYECFVPEHLKTLTVPKMILQPIVENAVYHGIEPLIEHGRLVLKAEEKNGNLLISVRDNGEGIGLEQLEELNEVLAFHNRSMSEVRGIGLVNVNNRLKLLYGAEYGISIRSFREFGTETVLRLPAHFVEEDQDVYSDDYRRRTMGY